jgi:uncharacterized membrane protein
MVFLIAGLAIFFVMHSIAMVAPKLRDALAARLGVLWQIGFAIDAAIGLGLIIYGYGQARLDPIVMYTPPPVLRYVALVLMLIAMPLVLATYLPGRIKATVKHPMLAAVKAWALAHLLVNGTMADVLLFGCFLVWAVANRISLKRRAPRVVPTLPASPANDIIAVVGGILLTVAFIYGLHAWLIGMPIVFPS